MLMLLSGSISCRSHTHARTRSVFIYSCCSSVHKLFTHTCIQGGLSWYLSFGCAHSQKHYSYLYASPKNTHTLACKLFLLLCKYYYVGDVWALWFSAWRKSRSIRGERKSITTLLNRRQKHFISQYFNTNRYLLFFYKYATIFLYIPIHDYLTVVKSINESPNKY